MLQLDQVTLSLGAFRLAADLRVAEGSFVSIMGPSGAGKSTLLSAIAGFQGLDHGRILWEKRDLAALRPAARPVSILFQDNNLFPHLTAEQNVGLGLRPSLRLSPQEQARVRASLSKVGLEPVASQRPGALSGGQRSRVALARVLLQDRPVLLLDEPFAALGPGQRAEMLDLVAGLVRANGTTVLMVTHDPSDARQLGGQTIFVADAVAQPPVETEGLFRNPPDALRDYLRM